MQVYIRCLSLECPAAWWPPVPHLYYVCKGGLGCCCLDVVRAIFFLSLLLIIVLASAKLTWRVWVVSWTSIALFFASLLTISLPGILQEEGIYCKNDSSEDCCSLFMADAKAISSLLHLFVRASKFHRDDSFVVTPHFDFWWPLQLINLHIHVSIVCLHMIGGCYWTVITFLSKSIWVTFFKDARVLFLVSGKKSLFHEDKLL